MRERRLFGIVVVFCLMGLFVIALSMLFLPTLPHGRVVRLATTTSTENSGLLAALLAPFEERTGLKVHVTAVGTGQALKIARDGDADLVLVHAPAAEKRFVEERHGLGRITVMSNDFVVVGPESDPANIRSATGAVDAFRKIAAARSGFVSRGDDSGTHQKEKTLWQAAGFTPKGKWYVEAGLGMAAALRLADEKRAYILVDRGTLLTMRKTLALETLFEGDPALFNPYAVIAVNPAAHPNVNRRGARKLIEWLTSKEGQKIIGEYKLDGQTLFHPTIVPSARRGAGRPSGTR